MVLALSLILQHRVARISQSGFSFRSKPGCVIALDSYINIVVSDIFRSALQYPVIGYTSNMNLLVADSLVSRSSSLQSPA